MANYGYNQGYVSRGKGKSAVAAAAYYTADHLRQWGPEAVGAAAYQAGESLEKGGRRFNFSGREDAVVHAEIMAPEGAPAWVKDREQLWNRADQAEKRRDARLARRLIISLQAELTDEQNIALLRDFVQERFVAKGIVADIAVHRPDRDGDERHIHAHVLLTRRELTEDGFGPKVFREAEQGRALFLDRKAWEKHCNRAFERAGITASISADSLFERGIVREPERVLGDRAIAAKRKGKVKELDTVTAERLDSVSTIRMRNQLRAELDARGEAHPDWLMDYYRVARDKWMAQQEKRIERVKERGNVGFAAQLERKLTKAKEFAREVDARSGRPLPEADRHRDEVRSERVERQQPDKGDRDRVHPSRRGNRSTDSIFGLFDFVAGEMRSTLGKEPSGREAFKARSRDPQSHTQDRRGNRRDTGDSIFSVIDFAADQVRDTFRGREEAERRRARANGTAQEPPPGKSQAPDLPGQNENSRDDDDEHER